MLADSDPMKGFYDRALVSYSERDIQVLRNLPQPFVDTSMYKRHAVEQGYASQETADFLWPESEVTGG